MNGQIKTKFRDFIVGYLNTTDLIERNQTLLKNCQESMFDTIPYVYIYAHQ